MFTLIVRPAMGFARADRIDPTLKALLFAFFAFFLFHNLTESDFLESDGASWVVYLMMMAALREPPQAALR
jgi:exopolysaccharide production protein ExoQ